MKLSQLVAAEEANPYMDGRKQALKDLKAGKDLAKELDKWRSKKKDEEDYYTWEGGYSSVIKEQARIPVKWPGAKAVWKKGNKYYFQGSKGLTTSYLNKEKFRYFLKNSANLPPKMVADLMKKLG